jgi:hypothetical protein
MSSIRFIFGVHNHQPVGNFDHVFEHHVREVYLPFLSALVEVLSHHPAHFRAAAGVAQ